MSCSRFTCTTSWQADAILMASAPHTGSRSQAGICKKTHVLHCIRAITNSKPFQMTQITTSEDGNQLRLLNGLQPQCQQVL
jgi:hypothetical protein